MAAQPLLLSDEQRGHYMTFGFLHLQRVLSEAEVQTLRDELAAVHAARYRSPLGDFNPRQLEPMLRQKTPLAASLPEDERFGGVAEQLQGPSVLCAINSYRFTGNTSWHPDFERGGEFGQCDSLVMAVYLDDPGLDGDSGALRVVPSSHVDPLHSAIFEETESTAVPFGFGE